MPSIGSKIKQHNARICVAEEESGSQPRSSNCCNPERCLLNGNCLANKIAYEETVETDGTHALKIYAGLTETSFKQHYVNHLMSFRYKKCGNWTELSKYIWGLKCESKSSAWVAMYWERSLHTQTCSRDATSVWQRSLWLSLQTSLHCWTNIWK